MITMGNAVSQVRGDLIILLQTVFIYKHHIVDNVRCHKITAHNNLVLKMIINSSSENCSLFALRLPLHHQVFENCPRLHPVQRAVTNDSITRFFLERLIKRDILFLLCIPLLRTLRGPFGVDICMVLWSGHLRI